MKSDKLHEFAKFCINEGIFFYRNRKINLSKDKLAGTMEVVFKEDNDRCEIYFGKDVKAKKVTELFMALVSIGNFHALELNNIAFIPPQIEKLVCLEQLDIYSKYMVDLPEEMKELTNLTELLLRLENLREVPKWVLSLKNLKILDLYGTRIEEIPDNINDLKNLKVLDLCCVHLKKMPCAILDLNLPFKDCFNEKDLPGIYFCDSTCENPSTEIIYGGRKRMEFYYNSYETVAQNEVRVILLGKKGAGKTSLVQRMCELEDGKPHFVEGNEWTEGISINDLKCNNGVLHVWDFGGQEMMLSTHTLFLRDHCIYIIVLNARQGDEPEGWLDYINQFGRNSSVFIVNNHMDMADISQVDINRLKRLYPDLSIVSDCIWETSCVKPDKFPINKLYEQILVSAEKYFSRKISYTWSSLNTKLGNMKKKGKSVNYITHEDYLKICDKCGIMESEEKVGALIWLNEIGTVFTYGNPRALGKMNEYKILKPVWVTDAIYRIINNNINLERDICLISHDEIRRALLYGKGENQTSNMYTDAEVVFILEVMRKFNLSFQCSEIDEFIPAVAKNKEFKEVAEWAKNSEEIVLDVLYSLSNNNKRKNNESSVNLAYFYQVIISIVKEFGRIPKMWRFGALFEDLFDMQVLLFLQAKGKWGYELRLMIKSRRGEEDRTSAANFHQCVVSYLKKFAANYIIDVKVLIREEEENDYFSINTAAKMLLNNQNSAYISTFDEKINLYDDVLMQVAPNPNGQLWKAVVQLRKEVTEGNRKTQSALDALNQICHDTSQLLIQMAKYDDMIASLKDNEPRWQEICSQAISNSQELKEQLQVILNSSVLQEHETVIIKDLLEELSNKNGDKKGIVDKVKKGLVALSTGVTLATADYNNISKITQLFEILESVFEDLVG